MLLQWDLSVDAHGEHTHIQKPKCIYVHTHGLNGLHTTVQTHALKVYYLCNNRDCDV